MNSDRDIRKEPVILEGEIIAPGPSGGDRRTHELPKFHVVKIGWFGKIIAILALLAVFAATIVLAAGALLIMLPVAIIGAIWGWWRIRKHKA